MPSTTPSDSVPHNDTKTKEHPLGAADLILHYLEQLDIRYVFGIPGGGIEPLYNALARSERRGGPRAVIARHESGAAFMADGYARETGKLGVCCATTGPGATNMITGVASAYLDRVPLLAITGQTALRSFGRGAMQESSCTGVNTVAMYQQCTLYSTLVSHVDQLETKLINAITIALQPPCGPVHLSIPLDILRESVKVYRGSNLASLLRPSLAVDDAAVDKLYRSLVEAKNAVFVLGVGAAEAVDNILELAFIINAQIITTPHGKGLVSSYHPRYRGVYGLAGHATAHGILKDPAVDMVLAIGTDLDELATNGWDSTALFSKKSIFIDTTTSSFARLPKARQHICGNIKGSMARLLTRFYIERKNDAAVHWQSSEYNRPKNFPVIPFNRRMSNRRKDTYSFQAGGGVVTPFYRNNQRRGEERRAEYAVIPATRRFLLADEDKYLSDAAPIKPQRLMYDLARLFPPTTRFLADIGNSLLWVIHYLHPFDRRVAGFRPHVAGNIRVGMGFMSMGWGVGAAIGTAMAGPGNPVVCITGDGALLMGGQELNTAVQEKLPIIFVILNDTAFGMVKHGQQLARAESIGIDLSPVDFVSYAQSMGAHAQRIDSPAEMAMLDISAICKRTGPTVFDVHIDKNEKPPLKHRIKTLKDPYA